MSAFNALLTEIAFGAFTALFGAASVAYGWLGLPHAAAAGVTERLGDVRRSLHRKFAGAISDFTVGAISAKPKDFFVTAIDGPIPSEFAISRELLSAALPGIITANSQLVDDMARIARAERWIVLAARWCGTLLLVTMAVSGVLAVYAFIDSKLGWHTLNHWVLVAYLLALTAAMGAIASFALLHLGSALIGALAVRHDAI